MRGPRDGDLGSGWPLGPGWPITGRGARGPSLFDATVPGATPASAVSVSTLAAAAQGKLESIASLWVRGEVSDFKAHRSGHWYFALRDQTAQLRCVVWSSDRHRIRVRPEVGSAVVAYGQLTLYAARGDVQLRVTALEATGDGLGRKAVERTLESLRRDGLLEPGRKRPLPRVPRCLAVVTSPDGAALHDIVAVARRRAPSLRIVVAAARVQGVGAPEELCAALSRLRRWGKADVIIVGRGGGAKEDLGAFNDERVARALADCLAPTVSAVGHEIDVTLCDLVADRRAATPSAAAEAAVPVMADEAQRLRGLAATIGGLVRRRVQATRVRLERVAHATRGGAVRSLERQRSHLKAASARLEGLSPLATLARGYSVARGADGKTLARTDDFVSGMPFDLIVRDGIVGALTAHITPDGPEGSP